MSRKNSVIRQAAISYFIRAEEELSRNGAGGGRELLQTYGKKEEAEFELG